MSNLGFREHAETAVRRISQSLFASEEENKNALNALADIRVAHNTAAVAEQTAAIDEILDAVMARESGRTQLRREERRSIEESLASLEKRLVDEIERRKVTQRRDLVLLACLLVVCLLGTLTAGLVLVLRPAESTEGMISGGLGLAAGLSCSIIVSRLIQNIRESLERLDEKMVAVRFLRMALHPSWTGEVGEALMPPALVMFAQHFAPSSTPLGNEDTVSILEAFKLK